MEPWFLERKTCKTFAEILWWEKVEEETGLRSEVEKTSLNKEEVTEQEEINLEDPKNTIFTNKERE